MGSQNVPGTVSIVGYTYDGLDMLAPTEPTGDDRYHLTSTALGDVNYFSRLAALVALGFFVTVGENDDP